MAANHTKPVQPGLPRRGRIDFTMKVESLDETTGKATISFQPDPKRYEWRMMDGTQRLYDKFDHVYLPTNIMEIVARSLPGQPIHYEPAQIKSAPEYAESRRPIVRNWLEGVKPEPQLAAPSDEFLSEVPDGQYDFVILSLDIVGSTRLAATHSSQHAQIIPIAAFEFGEAISLFRGHVLKNTGDGVIAYFPFPSFITKNDLAIDCALLLQRLVRDVLNPEFKRAGIPGIEIRIGLDSGPASVMVLGSPSTKRHKDIIGDVVSLACKIQALAPPGAVALGDVTLRNLHVDWRARCTPLSLPESWQYLDRETRKRYGVSLIN